MSNKVFQQNLDDKKDSQPGGPYLIQMLFKEPVDMPGKDEMTAVMKKHIGAVECFCRDKRTSATRLTQPSVDLYSSLRILSFCGQKIRQSHQVSNCKLTPKSAF